ACNRTTVRRIRNRTRMMARANGRFFSKKCVDNPPSTIRPNATTRGSCSAASITKDKSIILMLPRARLSVRQPPQDLYQQAKQHRQPSDLEPATPYRLLRI